MSALVRNGNSTLSAERPAATWSPLQSLFGVDPLQGIMRGWDYGFEVTRTETGYLVEVPVPGFSSSNIDVSFKDNVLTIHGKTDRRTIARSFTVPEDVDGDKISATVADGMLTISLDRLPEAQPKRIPVK